MAVVTTTDPVPRLLTIGEAAEALSVCTETVRRAVWRGELVATRIGRSVRVSVTDLRAYLASRRQARG